MQIVSFDVGRKNLACCMYSSESAQITFWKIFDIGERNGAKLIVDAFEQLDNHPILLTGDIVLVERQPHSNPPMRIIEAIVESYFVGKGLKTIDYSSRFKLGNMDLTSLGNLRGKTNYSVRKKAAIQICKVFLTENPQPTTIQHVWDTCKKKDDLADCFLQALSYKDSDTETKITLPPPSCQYLPKREPKEKNEKGRIFTRCQVKWFCIEWFGSDLQCSEEEVVEKLKLHPRVLRSVNSHWRRSVPQCLLQLRLKKTSLASNVC
jgi:hypothetical protein